MLEERGILKTWVQRAIQQPDKIEDHADGTRHYLKMIQEQGNRWLRVIVNITVEPNRGVTVFFDRRFEDRDMKIKIDKKSDALYFRLDESKIVESEEVRPGIILDFDDKENVVGIEFLNISARVTNEELSSLQFQTM